MNAKPYAGKERTSQHRSKGTGSAAAATATHICARRVLPVPHCAAGLLVVSVLHVPAGNGAPRHGPAHTQTATQHLLVLRLLHQLRVARLALGAASQHRNRARSRAAQRHRYRSSAALLTVTNNQYCDQQSVLPLPQAQRHNTPLMPTALYHPAHHIIPPQH